MNIQIYDIFGININDNNHFNKDYIVIDISADNIDLILQPINQYNGVIIYKYKPSNYLIDYCNNININLDEYVKLGDYIIYDTNNTKILLSHKNNVLLTNRYVLIDTIGQLYIWKPYTINKNYTNLGVICIDQPHIIPSEYIGLIPNDHVKIFDSTYNDLFQNDYSLLGNKKNGRRKLISMNIIHNIENGNDNGIIKDINITNNKWEKYKGKYFVLKESDDPWYVHINQTIKTADIKTKDFFKKYKENMNDNIYNNKIVEYNDKSNYIILILLVLVISLFFYNKYYRKNKNKNNYDIN
jgi:hypothetical protein